MLNGNFSQLAFTFDVACVIVCINYWSSFKKKTTHFACASACININSHFRDNVLCSFARFSYKQFYLLVLLNSINTSVTKNVLKHINNRLRRRRKSVKSRLVTYICMNWKLKTFFFKGKVTKQDFAHLLLHNHLIPVWTYFASFFYTNTQLWKEKKIKSIRSMDTEKQGQYHPT